LSPTSLRREVEAEVRERVEAELRQQLLNEMSDERQRLAAAAAAVEREEEELRRRLQERERELEAERQRVRVDAATDAACCCDTCQSLLPTLSQRRVIVSFSLAHRCIKIALTHDRLYSL
jgi:hypothetical protein